MKQDFDKEFWPSHIIKDQNIEAAVWEVSTAEGDVFRVRVSRVYRADGERKYSNLFSPDELLRVSKITADAYSWITKYKN